MKNTITNFYLKFQIYLPKTLPCTLALQVQKVVKPLGQLLSQSKIQKIPTSFSTKLQIRLHFQNLQQNPKLLTEEQLQSQSLGDEIL